MRRAVVDPARQRLQLLKQQLENDDTQPALRLPLTARQPPASARRPPPAPTSNAGGASCPPWSARGAGAGGRAATRRAASESRERHAGTLPPVETSGTSLAKQTFRSLSEGPASRSKAKVLQNAGGYVAGLDRPSSRGSSPQRHVPGDDAPQLAEDFAVFAGSNNSLRRLAGTGGTLDQAPVAITSNGEGPYIFLLLAGGELRFCSATAPHERPRTIPLAPLRGIQVATLAVGTAHAAIIAADGRLFEARGPQPQRWMPRHLARGCRFFTVACGDAHTVATGWPADSVGEGKGSEKKPHACLAAFTWGVGRAGQLGQGVPLRNMAEPRRVSGLDNAAGPVACGMHHTLVAVLDSLHTTEGGLFTFGWSENGRLGPDSRQSSDAFEEGEACSTPARVELPTCTGSVAQVAAGAQHSVIVMSSGEFWGFGSNEFGQLGRADIGACSSSLVRFKLSGQAADQIAQVFCGSTSTVAVTAAGEVHCWGDMAASARGLCSHARLGQWVESAVLAGGLLILLIRCGKMSAASVRQAVADNVMRKRVEEERIEQESRDRTDAEKAAAVLAQQAALARQHLEHEERHQHMETHELEEGRQYLEVHGQEEEKGNDDAQHIEVQQESQKSSLQEEVQLQDDHSVQQQADLSQQLHLYTEDDSEQLVEEVPHLPDVRQLEDAPQETHQHEVSPLLQEDGLEDVSNTTAGDICEQDSPIVTEPDALLATEADCCPSEPEAGEVEEMPDLDAERISPAEEEAVVNTDSAGPLMLPTFLGNHGDRLELRAQRRRARAGGMQSEMRGSAAGAHASPRHGQHPTPRQPAPSQVVLRHLPRQQREQFAIPAPRRSARN